MTDLTPAEDHALLAYARLGYRQEAADACGVSIWTLANQLRSAYRKLGADNAIEAFRARGLLVVPEPHDPAPASPAPSSACSAPCHDPVRVHLEDAP